MARVGQAARCGLAGRRAAAAHVAAAGCFPGRDGGAAQPVGTTQRPGVAQGSAGARRGGRRGKRSDATGPSLGSIQGPRVRNTRLKSLLDRTPAIACNHSPSFHAAPALGVMSKPCSHLHTSPTAGLAGHCMLHGFSRRSLVAHVLAELGNSGGLGAGDITCWHGASGICMQQASIHCRGMATSNGKTEGRSTWEGFILESGRWAEWRGSLGTRRRAAHLRTGRPRWSP